MPHLALIGDSIFDNAEYVEGGPAVIDQVKRWLSAGWHATLLAVDGNTTAGVPEQLARLPKDTSHLVLSIGGNDALGCIPSLEARAGTVMEGLATLTQMKAEFQASYGALITTVLTLKKPLLIWPPKNGRHEVCKFDVLEDCRRRLNIEPALPIQY